VVEWHSRMETLRLEELKKSRQIQRLTDQVCTAFLSGVNVQCS